MLFILFSSSTDQNLVQEFQKFLADRNHESWSALNINKGLDKSDQVKVALAKMEFILVIGDDPHDKNWQSLLGILPKVFRYDLLSDLVNIYFQSILDWMIACRETEGVLKRAGLGGLADNLPAMT